MLAALILFVFSFSIIGVEFSSIEAQEDEYSFVSKWGSEGVGFGKFAQPLDIAIDSNDNLYVTDTTSVSNQIQKFAPNGTFISSWGVLGSEDGQFARATGIATDSSDNIYVSDGGSAETAVQKFTSDGTFITSWGSTGFGDGQFIAPGGVDVDSSDNVYVGDFGENNRVQKFDSNGNFLLLITY